MPCLIKFWLPKILWYFFENEIDILKLAVAFQNFYLLIRKLCSQLRSRIWILLSPSKKISLRNRRKFLFFLWICTYLVKIISNTFCNSPSCQRAYQQQPAVPESSVHLWNSITNGYISTYRTGNNPISTAFYPWVGGINWRRNSPCWSTAADSSGKFPPDSDCQSLFSIF